MNVLFFVFAAIFFSATLYSLLVKGREAKTASEGAGVVVAFMLNVGLVILLMYAGFNV